MEQNLGILFSVIVTPKLIKFFGIDPNFSSVLQTFITSFAININYSKYLLSLEKTNLHLTEIIIIIFLVSITYIFREYIIDFFQKIFNKNYASIKFFRNTQLTTFQKYIKMHPHFYDKIKDNKYGDPDFLSKINKTGFHIGQNLDAINDKNMSEENLKIYFNDSNFNIKGYYTWNKEIIEQKNFVNDNKKENVKEQIDKINYNYITLYIELNKDTDINKYYNNIKNIVDEDNQINITKTFTKILYNDEIKRPWPTQMKIYKGPKKDREYLKNLYIKSFFHKSKDHLWKVIENIEYNPEKFIVLGQNPRLNLLLYGPPGTGKSSFAYRVAMALNRNIISIDLRMMKKTQVYSQFFSSDSVDSIYILDEFDVAVKELSERKKRKSIEIEIFRKSIVNQLEKDLDDTKNIMTNDKKTDVKTDVKTETKKILIPDNHDELLLDDLLELLQGAVPFNQSIIIATTNDYEGIKDLCPALFRNGRLSPIYFGYVDNNILNEMCLYFFQKELKTDINVEEKKLAPSYIIEIITEAKLINEDNSYEYFIDKINKILFF